MSMRVFPTRWRIWRSWFEICNHFSLKGVSKAQFFWGSIVLPNSPEYRRSGKRKKRCRCPLSRSLIRIQFKSRFRMGLTVLVRNKPFHSATHDPSKAVMAFLAMMAPTSREYHLGTQPYFSGATFVQWSAVTYSLRAFSDLNT